MVNLRPLLNRKLLFALIIGVIILGAWVVLGPLLARPPYSPPVPAGKEIEVLRIAQIAGGMKGWAANFYPFSLQDFSADMIVSHYLEALINLDSDLRPYGILAERWINPEPTVWRFFLVRNATFSSGSQFDADDIVFTINTLKNEDYVNEEHKMAAASISEVRKVDQFTVDLVTEKPDPILLSKLRYVWMLSNEDFDSTDTTHPPIGTGPYLITDAKKDEFCELTRREDYWAELPKPKKVIYKVFADDPETEADESTPAIIQALLDGEIDIADYMSPDDREEFDANPDFRTTVKGDVYLWYVGLDMKEKSPYVFDKKTGKPLAKNPLSDKRVRQALYYAINVDELIQNTYGGLAERQDQLVPKEAFGYDPTYTRPSYDLEKAKELLTEAGYPNGFAINLDAYHPYVTGNYLPEVVRQWGKIGIKTTAVTRREDPEVPGSAEDRERFEKGDTSCYFSSTTVDLGDALPALTSQVHTMVGEYGYDNPLYSNSEVDRLIEQAETTVNQDERLELMQRVQRMVLDDFAYIPLNTDGILYFVRDNLIWEPRIDSLIYGFAVAGK